MLSRLLLSASLLVGGAAVAAAQTSLTIYNTGRVLMRRTFPIAVPQGPSTQVLALGQVEPGSVFALDPDIAVLGSAYDAAIDEPGTLRRAVGRRLVFDLVGSPRDSVVAEVLSAEPERYRLPSGEVVFSRPGRPRYPADLVALAPTTTVTVQGTARRPSLGLGWMTSGAGWNADYQLIVGRGPARIAGNAVITNGALVVDSAEVQLLAGEVGQPRPMFRGAVVQMAAMAAEAAPSEEAVGESHVYTLPGRHTLRPGIVTSVPLFTPTTTAWERVYTVRGQLPWSGALMQEGDEARVPVEVQYVLKRPRTAAFGDRPLPAGNWRIFEADAAGRLQLVGESASRHVPAGEDLRLSAGTAFDLTASRVQSSYSTAMEGRRTVATAAYTVRLTNAKDSSAVVDVLEERQGEWQVVTSSVPAERLSSTRTRFRVRVPARGEATLTYTVRATW